MSDITVFKNGKFFCYSDTSQAQVYARLSRDGDSYDLVPGKAQIENTIEQLVSEAANNYNFASDRHCFKAGTAFAAPLYREEGFMMAVNTLKENDGAAGFATIWADYLLANKDKILGVIKK